MTADTKVLTEIEEGLNHTAEVLTQAELDSLLTSLSTGEIDMDNTNSQSSTYDALYKEDTAVLSQSEIDQLINLIHKINKCATPLSIQNSYDEGYKQGFIDGVKHGMDICEGNISK